MTDTKRYTIVALESGFADDCGTRPSFGQALAFARSEAAERGVSCEVTGPEGFWKVSPAGIVESRETLARRALPLLVQG